MADSDGRGTGPIAWAIFGSTVVIAGAVLINECGRRSAATREADTARIMQAMNTDPVQAGKNLTFLVRAELIGNKPQREKWSKLLGETRYGTGPSLAAADPSSSCPTPVDAREGLPKDWLAITCDYWWPRNFGFEGTPKAVELKPDTILDRFGGPNGTFLSPVKPGEVPFEKRSLPYGEKKVVRYQYKVLKAFNVQEGPAAAWFDQPGGGIQYKTPKPIKDLVAEKFLEDVK